MNVAIADIEETALAKAPAALQADESRLRGFVCDTADRASLHRAADAAIAAFGRVHVVCNNAGVGGRPGGIAELTERQWEWVLSVNLMGVVHGIAAFLPHMRAHGEGGHFLNALRWLACWDSQNGRPYRASKAIADGRRFRIAVLRVARYEHRRQRSMPRLRAHGDRIEQAQCRFCWKQRKHASVGSWRGACRPHAGEFIAGGIAPAEVAARALEGIVDGDLYIFTHPDMRPMLQKRLARINAAYDKAERFVFNRG